MRVGFGLDGSVRRDDGRALDEEEVVSGSLLRLVVREVSLLLVEPREVERVSRCCGNLLQLPRLHVADVTWQSRRLLRLCLADNLQDGVGSPENQKKSRTRVSSSLGWTLSDGGRHAQKVLVDVLAEELEVVDAVEVASRVLGVRQQVSAAYAVPDAKVGLLERVDVRSLRLLQLVEPVADGRRRDARDDFERRVPGVHVAWRAASHADDRADVHDDVVQLVVVSRSVSLSVGSCVRKFRGGVRSAIRPDKSNRRARDEPGGRPACLVISGMRWSS